MRTSGFILWICLFCLSPPLSGTALSAALVPLDDAELADVRGQSGIAIAIDRLKIYYFDDGLAISDTVDGVDYTNNNRLGFYDIMISINRLTTNFGFTLRVYQNQWYYTMVALEALRYEGLDMPAIDMNMDVYVLDFAFYDAATATTSELGGLYVAGFSPSEFALYAAPLGSIQNSAAGIARTGLGFQLETRLEIDEFRWEYNDNADELRFGGMQMTGWFDPSGNDYTDPNTWTADGRFVIGRMDPRDEESGSFVAAPATFHVVEDTSDPFDRSFLRIQLPMEGSIRIAETDFGAKTFGPAVIDGIYVHHLQVDLYPW